MDQAAFYLKLRSHKGNATMDSLFATRLLATVPLLCIAVWGGFALHYQLSGWQAKLWMVLWGLAAVLALIVLWRQRL